MSFAEQLTITIVDKLLIGMVVAIAVFLFSRNLERLKSRQALTSEFAKQRVLKLAELWNSLDDFEHQASRVTRAIQMQLASGDLSHSADDPNGRFYVEVLERGREIQALIEQSHFWLGDDMHRKLRSHWNEIMNQLNLLSESSAASVDFNAMRARLASSRDSILNYMHA